MPLFKQLELFDGALSKLPGDAVSFPSSKLENLTRSPADLRVGRDLGLEAQARELLQPLGMSALADLLRVTWSGRLRTAAGRADYGRKLITLNPRLVEHGAEEIDRTFRHELAHLVAQHRARRRRIQPHGAEWRHACGDLGIDGETRCHSLPFPAQKRARRFLYRCPGCAREFPRVRRIRRGLACLACCRRYNRGRYDKRFQLQLVAFPATF